MVAYLVAAGCERGAGVFYTYGADIIHAARAVAGMCGLMTIPARMYIADMYPENASVYMSRMSMVTGITIVVGPYVGGQLQLTGPKFYYINNTTSASTCQQKHV